LSLALVAAVDPVRVLAERDRILATREFNPEPDWRTRILEWLLERAEGLASLLPVGLRVVGLLLLLLALGLLLAWLLRRHRSVDAGRARSAARPAPQPGMAALRDEAGRALAEGRLAEAVRYAWLAALALLDQAGVSAARVGRADWEHVAAARRQRPDLAPPLADLALAFQRIRYGRAAPERAEADRCLGLLGVLERALHG
jgi:Domain of unknown function (DUF4129)